MGNSTFQGIAHGGHRLNNTISSSDLAGPISMDWIKVKIHRKTTFKKTQR
jgi:hypothetical protein